MEGAGETFEVNDVVHWKGPDGFRTAERGTLEFLQGMYGQGPFRVVYVVHVPEHEVENVHHHQKLYVRNDGNEDILIDLIGYHQPVSGRWLTKGVAHRESQRVN